MGRFTVKKPMIKEKQTTVTGRRIEKLKESTSCGKRIWVRRTVMAAIFFILILAAYRLNTMKKTELVTHTGNTYEKGVVQKVLQDNLQADGTRSGEQVVTVKMTTGVRKGEVIQMTSASGFLFGTACTPGLHVIVVQSVSGDSTVSSVYSRDRGGVILLFGLLYLVALIAVGGRQGLKASAGLIITFFIIIFIWIPLIYLPDDHSDLLVHRRNQPQDDHCNARDGFRCCDRRNLCGDFLSGDGNQRLECLEHRDIADDLGVKPH